MKLKALVTASILASMWAASALADSVAVSSFTVTTLSGSNSGRRAICIQNTTTNPVYFAKTTAAATVAAGMVLPSSATTQVPFCINEFTGTVYGLAGAGAVGEIRKFETLR